MADTLRILVVDDDEADRMLLRRALTRSGLALVVEEAASIREAVARITAEPPLDCVIVDLHLPDGSPEPIVRLPGRAFAVVVVTGLDRESFSSLAVIAEADDCLPKDEVDGPTIARVVNGALARKAGGT